jgi:hypothetical protein
MIPLLILPVPKPMRIFISGPYSKGDTAINVRDAISAGNYLAGIGHYPFIPHLNHFWHFLWPNEDINFWYEQDIVWLHQCEALLRIPGESAGADREVEIAKEMEIPIYYSVLDVPRVK